MISLANNLRALMAHAKISESELSRRTGISQPVIHRMASGETASPKLDSVQPLAAYFNITLDEIAGLSRLPTTTYEVQQPTQLPLLTAQQACDWPDLPSDETLQVIIVDFPVGSDAFAFCLDDTTMEPRFPRKAIAIIDPEVEPSDQGMLAVHVKGQPQVTLRQLLVDGHQRFAKPLNTDFPITPLDPSHRVLGVMVQARVG